MESDGLEPQNDSEEQVINKNFTKRTEIGNLNFYNQIIKLRMMKFIFPFLLFLRFNFMIYRDLQYFSNHVCISYTEHQYL